MSLPRRPIALQLAYLMAKVMNDESWTGGLLVTDQRGLPVDFRYVEPIRPTRLQRVIYGGALKRYLLLDAIAGTLLKAANTKAGWVFTSDQLLLELEGSIPARFVALGCDGDGPTMALAEWRKEGVGKVAIQVTPGAPAVTLTFNSRDDADTETVAAELASLAEKLDFTEPLNRVGEALMEICHNGTD